jgi:hypothetical protein
MPNSGTIPDAFVRHGGVPENPGRWVIGALNAGF